MLRCRPHTHAHTRTCAHAHAHTRRRMLTNIAQYYAYTRDQELLLKHLPATGDPTLISRP